MYGLLLGLHLLVCFSLIGVVLVQSGKGGGLAGGAFGGSAQTVLGGRGATDFFTKATMVLGSLFFLTSLTLAYMSTGVATRSRSLIQSEAQRKATTGPQAVPGTPPAGSSAPPSSGTPAGGTPPAPTPAGGGK